MNKKNIIIPISYSTFFFMIYIFTIKEISVTDLILRLSFGTFGNSMGFLGDAIFQYFLIVFAHVIFGSRLFKNFCNATAYFYVRTINLKRWFLGEAVNLLIDIIKFYFINLFVLIGLCLFSGKMHKFEFNDILFILYFISLYSMFTFITCIILNIISIYADSGISFMLVEGLNTIFIGLYLITGNIFSTEYLMNHSYIFKLNPICHLIIHIHKSNLSITNKYLTYPLSQTSLSASFIFLLLCTILIVIASYFMIDKMDLIGDKLEGE